LVDKVIYAIVSLGGQQIRLEKPHTTQSYYWYEDFQDFHENVEKRKELKPSDIHIAKLASKAAKASKIPPISELTPLAWTMPATKIAKIYGVSDRTITNWMKKYTIVLPPRGYWTGKL